MKKNLLLLLLTALLALGHAADATARDRRTRVRFETTLGTFTIALFDETPLHRDNFIRLVGEGYYDGLLFHRVIEKFMVQAGDPDSRDCRPGQQLGDGGPDYTLPAEIALPYRYHYRGAVAAAREGDDVNPQRRSSGSQFYVVWGKTFTGPQIGGMADYVAEMTGGEYTMTGDMMRDYQARGGAPHLDGQYTVFGEVVEGLRVIGAMQKVPTDAHDRPLEDVRIIRATLLR